ncbi:MAG: S-layer homology domain-containing protein [Oscillospiraceae bacterium]|nr:S-layer homology domain-containing protein [Oscillospiraceae bacterium]
MQGNNTNGRRFARPRFYTFVAFLLAVCLLAPTLAPALFWHGAHAASPVVSVRNYIERAGGTAVGLRVEWSSPSLADIKTARAVWVDRRADGSPEQKYIDINATPILDAAGNPTGGYRDLTPVTLSVRDCEFKYDILYQINILLYDGVDAVTGGPDGSVVYNVETVFMLGISVGAEGVINDKVREARPGAKETGYSPALAASFKIPRVYVNAAADGGPYAVHPNGAFMRIFGGDPGDPSNVGYQAALGAVRRLRPGIDELNLVLGLENLIVLTNLYVPLNEIRLYWDQAESAYMAEVDFRGGEIYRAAVADSGAASDDWRRVYLSGRVDADALMPDDAEWGVIGLNQNLMDGIIPPEILGGDSFASVMRFKDMYPGSIYRLHAEMQYMAGGAEVMEIVGSGFEIVGERPSVDAETALRIIITKVTDEYVKVEVFRINLGNDFVSDNGYKVTGTPETSSAFGPEMEVVVNDFHDAPASLQVYMRVTNPTVRYYFQAIYTHAGMDGRPVSARIPYILQDSGDNVPIMPKGLVVERLEYDPVRRMTDVTVSWDRPANWVTATSNDIYIEFDLNTSHVNQDAATELVDGEGGVHGIFAPMFRTVLAIRREEIQSPSAGRLSYTFKGDELFNVVYGAAPAYPPPPVPIAPDSLYDALFWDDEMEKGRAPIYTGQYPSHLLPNTRYFLTLRSVLWMDDAGVSVRTESNASSAVAFTTYPTVYEVPLPFSFAVTANPPPLPPDYENSVSLQNSAVDWHYASAVYNPAIPVHYELYISDRADDPKPQLAGVTHFNADGTPFASWAADAGWGGGMRLPPYDASSPAGLAGALIAGRMAAGLSGGSVNWDELKYYDGEKLQPNKIYYFWIRTYIIEEHIINGATVRPLNGVKAFSIMLSATTPPWPQGYDDDYMRRIAPVDFDIAKDAAGNLMITGESATFEWTPTAPDAVYELVITSVRDVNGFFMPGGSGLLFGDPALTQGLDFMYESFIGEFSGDDGRAPGRRLLLDPLQAGAGGTGGTSGSGGTSGTSGAIRGFYWDPASGKFSYTIDRWLFPNSLYYVSLRAVSRDPDPNDLQNGISPPDPRRPVFYTVFNNTSPFVTVPLTTLLLDAPFGLKTIVGAEIGFAFTDKEANPAADYRIYMRGPGQSDYMLVGGSQGSIVKDNGVVYGRVSNLDFGERYDIRVTRGLQSPEQVYQMFELAPRDPYNSVQVEWLGTATWPNDAFLRYQVAIISQTELEGLPPDEVEYYELSDLHLAPSRYVVDGKEYPYEIYENAQTLNMDGIMAYRATILSKPTRLRDGSVAQRPLQPNMRYYIKVRTRKISRDDASLSAFSRFTGPVEARTDFLQSSQDEIEEQRRLEDNLMDKLAEYERETFYIADAGDMAQGKFLLKEDKIVGMIKTSASAGYLIDVSENLKRAAADTLYVPGGILLALQEYDKTLTIRLEGVEYTFARNTIDLRYEKVYQDLAARAGTREFLVRLRESRAPFGGAGAGSGAGAAAPVGNEGITAMHRLEASVIASNRSYGNIANIVNEYIYNERTGLVNQKLAALTLNTEAPGSAAGARAGAGAGAAIGSGASASPYETEEAQNRERNAEQAKREANDAYVQELANDIKSQASYLIGDVLEGRNGYRSLVADVVNVTDFNAPLVVTLFYAQARRNGRVSPFISYDSKEWFKLTQSIAERPNSISFEAISPGHFSAVLAAVSTAGAPEGSGEEAALLAVASRFDLSDIFTGIDREFQPALPVLNREAVLLYERVLGLEGETFGMNISQKIAALGLSDIVRPGTQNAQMDRQRAAALLHRLYAGTLGLGGGANRGGGGAAGGASSAGAGVSGTSADLARKIADAQAIDAQYVASVEFCVGRGLLKLTNGRFEPTRPVTRAELISGLAAILTDGR